MKLSTRGRYGILAMFDLARFAGEPPQPLKAIAERENIPEPYLEQLMALLRRSGLVISSRGAQGGYTLSDAPENISVGRVLRATEGSLSLIECLDNDEACGRTCDCAPRLVWRRLQMSIEEAVDNMTLKDMLDDFDNIHKQST